jgi:hypothetical protein
MQLLYTVNIPGRRRRRRRTSGEEEEDHSIISVFNDGGRIIFVCNEQ